MKKQLRNKYKNFIDDINANAEKILEGSIVGYFVFGLVCAFFYDTWLIALGVGGLSILLYYGSKLIFKQGKVHHYVGSLVLGIFMAQFIYQMHGLFEMHFTAIIAIIILMAFQDPRIFIPITLFIGVHHASFAYIQYVGFTQNIDSYQSIYFTQLDYMDLQTFIFHAGLVGIAVGVATAYTHVDRKRSIVLFDNFIDNRKRSKQLKKNIEIANSITNKNYDVEIKTSKDDPMSFALADMLQKLKEGDRREKRDRFINKGLAELSDLLRNQNDLKELTYDIITFLVKYLKQNQGAFYLVNDEDKDNITIDMSACYAYERKKQAKGSYLPGEGLIGQSFQEKDSIYLTDVPEQYINITSGLGKANPKNIVIIPVKKDDDIVGVIEIAGFNVLEDYEVEFIERASESIAVSINSSRINEQTLELYQESQEQTEQMRAQEEEMRQNMEELSATQEEMDRAQKDYERRIQELEKENTELKAKLS